MEFRRFYGIGIACLGLIAGVYFLTLPGTFGALPDDIPELRALPAGTVEYRPTGDFRVEGRVTLAPSESIEIPGNLEIMRHPVTQEAYAKCVKSGACRETRTSGAPDLPQTYVNFRDAMDFAAWQSARTGQTWRLPTGPEWAYAAAEMFVDEELDPAADINTTDPAQRWLWEYRQNAKQRKDADPALRPLESYMENSFGIGYIGGNVWEWTTTCFQSGDVGTDGQLIQKDVDYCGVRLAQGLHRAFIIDFVRDASVGGCAVGLPPDYLGIRLVREN